MTNNGYFPFPNIVIDELLSSLTGAQFKVLSLIVRQTLGWRKYWDRISIGQFEKKCGLSRQGVLDSLKTLLENELILCDKVIQDGKLPQNWFALFGETSEQDRLVKSVDQYDKLTSQVIVQELVNSVDRLGGKLVNSVDPQKKEDTKETKQTGKNVICSSPSAMEEEPPVLTPKNDSRIIEGAILNKYRSQIGDKPPSVSKLTDALESYRVDQLTEAIDRMPDILKARDGSKIDGNFALSLACKTAKNPHWWKELSAGKQEQDDELRMAREYLKGLEEDKEGNEDKPDYQALVAEAKQDIKELEARNGTD